MDHVEAILNHTNEEKNPIIDYIISNNGKIPDYLVDKYRMEGANLVPCEGEDSDCPYKFIIDDYVEVKKNYVRHDGDKLAYSIFKLIAEEKLSKDITRNMDYNHLMQLLRIYKDNPNNSWADISVRPKLSLIKYSCILIVRRAISTH